MPVTLNSVLQIIVFLLILLLLTRPMGLYLTAVFSGERTWLAPVLGPVERLFYRLCGIDPAEEQKWTGLCHCYAALQCREYAADLCDRAYAAVVAQC
jgi:K+-transporting ATPase A subunit